MRRGLVVLVVAAALTTSCGSDDPATEADPAAEPDPAVGSDDSATEPDPAAGSEEVARFPDVVEVTLVPTGEQTFTVEVTMSSPYDSPERYADGWRVIAPDGTVLGIRDLLHDHAAEQPFTRSLNDVEIPPGVSEVTVEGRDQISGWGGATVTVPVPSD